MTNWERKLLRFLSVPDFSEGGDDSLMRNIEIDSMNFVFLASETALMHLKGKEKISLAEVLTGIETTLIKRDAKMRVDYYQPFHPVKRQKSILHARTFDKIMEIFVTETMVPKEDEDDDSEDISEEGKLTALSAIASKLVLSLEEFIKILLIFDRPDTAEFKKQAEEASKEEEEEEEEEEPDDLSGFAAAHRPGRGKLGVEGRNSVSVEGSGTGWGGGDKKTGGGDKILSTTSEEEDQPQGKTAKGGEKKEKDKKAKDKKDKYFVPAPNRTIEEVCGDRCDNGLPRTKFPSRVRAFTRIFSRCYEITRACSTECLYNPELFDVYGMHEITQRLGRLVTFDWYCLDRVEMIRGWEEYTDECPADLFDRSRPEEEEGPGGGLGSAAKKAVAIML